MMHLQFFQRVAQKKYKKYNKGMQIEVQIKSKLMYFQMTEYLKTTEIKATKIEKLGHRIIYKLMKIRYFQM